MEKLDFSEKNFPRITEELNQERAIIMPSDTSYGFSGSPFSKKAIEAIQEIKGRSEQKPFLLLVSSLEQAEELGEFSPELKKFALKRCKEGCIPTTVLLKRKTILPDFFPQFSTIAVRVPASQLMKKFLTFWEKPLISTSANRSGEKPIFLEENIIQEFQKENILFLSAGNLSLKSQSEIWKEENTNLVRVR